MEEKGKKIKMKKKRVERRKDESVGQCASGGRRLKGEVF